MTRHRLVGACVAAAVLVGAVLIWHHTTARPSENERTAMARLTLLLPDLDPGVNAKASTYVCDDDAVKPCHAASRTWSVADRSLTLDQLARDITPWATANHLAVRHSVGTPWNCESDSDVNAKVSCVAGLSTGQQRLQVEVTVDLAGAGGRPAPMSDGVARAGTRHASVLTVRTVAYPRENGTRLRRVARRRFHVRYRPTWAGR